MSESTVTRDEFDGLAANVSALRTIAARRTPTPRAGRDGRDAVVDYRRIDRQVELIALDKVAKLHVPKDGEQGPEGPRGLRGGEGQAGPRGPKGDKGDQGEDGPIPDHKWVDTTKLAFRKPDGTYEKPVELQGPVGPPGPPGTSIAGAGTFDPPFFSYQPAGFL